MAKNQVDQARQTDSDIAVMMVDIDLFKSVNDIYGHQVGDRVIREIAHETKRTMRETDLIGRFGGEEFICLLTNIEENESWVVAERLRERIESLVIQTEFYNINVTISIGVSHINAGSTGMESLFSRADKALYEAKSSGRNRVVTWKNSSMFLPYNPRPVIREEHHTKETGSTEEILHLYDETIEGWARALEMRDKETEGHAQRVTTLAVRMAQEIGFHKDDCENIRRGALLHDIGKIAIPDSVLLKEGKLDAEEWEIMKRHPVYAFDFLSPIKFLQNVIDIPYCHHEHWNGCGYPRGLKGEEIPLSARIFTLVDVFDALMTDRCYRPAWTRAATIDYIHSQTGLMFDPNLVPIFLDLISQKDTIEPLFTSKLLLIE
jgi:diguanylate cyclase (GGDEF)-like protein/putative nucleotidyltransferase with HDIG domain